MPISWCSIARDRGVASCRRRDRLHRARAAVSRSRAERRRILQGQERRSPDRLQRRRRIRRLRAGCLPVIWAGTSPAIPTVVPRNMPGAGSLVLANWLSNVGAEGRHRVRHHRPRHRLRSAARDRGRASSTRRRFLWVGSMNNEVERVREPGTRQGSPRFEDTLAKEMVVGGTGPSADTDQFPRITNARARHQVQDRRPAIPAATTSTSRWSAARCTAAAAGRGRA